MNRVAGISKGDLHSSIISNRGACICGGMLLHDVRKMLLHDVRRMHLHDVQMHVHDVRRLLFHDVRELLLHGVRRMLPHDWISTDACWFLQ